MNQSTKKIVTIGVLTALYVVLSAMFKVSLGIGAITLDLGYIAFAVSLCEFGVWGAVVGVLGCAIESMLFTPYGFSISWVVANLIIGLGCGIVFNLSCKTWVRAVSVVAFCIVGLLCAKTAIECALYSIPLAVKIPKNAVACAADAAVMLFGMLVYRSVRKR